MYTNELVEQTTLFVQWELGINRDGTIYQHLTAPPLSRGVRGCVVFWDKKFFST